MTNLVVNPSFESDGTSWVLETGTTTITSTQAHSGTKSVKIVDIGAVRKDDTAEHFDCNLEQIWTLSVWMKNESFVGAGGIRLQRRNSTTGVWEAWISSEAKPALGIGSGWFQFTASGRPTSSMDKVRARVAFAGTGTIYIDDIELTVTTDIETLPTDPSLPGGSGHDDLHDHIHRGSKFLKTQILALSGDALRNVSGQTIAGVKTFSSSPILSGAAETGTMITKEYADDGFSGKESEIAAPGSDPELKYFRGDKTWVTLSATAAGIGSLDNTSDLDKPISTALQTALDAKEPTITLSDSTKYRRGDETWQTLDKSAVGLGNVNNTADLDKPISTATQTALNAKVDISDATNLTGNQDIDGVKTFSTSPKLIGGATVDYVWTATNVNGAGEWAELIEPETTVDWDNVTSVPTTFPATIGSTATEAAAGNHTHTKSDVGLGNLDNTADADKPVTTAETTALNAIVPSTRTVSAGTGLTGGGTLEADRTISINNGGVGISQLATASKKEGIAYVQTLTVRATGLGQIIDGLIMPFDCNIVSVKYRMGTADASGTTTVELRKNDSTVSGTSGTASTSPTAVTGSWGFSAGDKLTVYTTAIGTTPGSRLTADIIVERS